MTPSEHTGKKGRGPGKKHNERFSLLVQHPDRVSERLIVRVSGRSSDPLDVRHHLLLEMEQYCLTHHIVYQWFVVSPGQVERVLYLTIERTSRARGNVKCKICRLGLTFKQVGMLPMMEETTAPNEGERQEEVQV